MDIIPESHQYSLTLNFKHMKKTLFGILLTFIPIISYAQRMTYFGKTRVLCMAEADTYMQGAVSIEDGKVVFRDTLDVPGKSSKDIERILSQWASFRFSQGVGRGYWSDRDYFKNGDFASVKSVEDNRIECQGNEDMVFMNQALSKDYCIVNYIFSLEYAEGKIYTTMRNINYIYAGSNNEQIRAEEWITDEECIRKLKTGGYGFYKQTGKFRVKTIDLKNELVRELKEKFDLL